MESIPGADRETDAGSYRSISGLAVAAAAAGVLSAGCLVSPALWVVPLVAIALAVAALREIGREGSVKVGRIPAIIGLALAVGFGMQSVAYRTVNDWLVQARAATAAREFVRAAQESRFADARDMCGPTALLVRENVHGLPAASQKSGQDDPSALLPAVALLARCPPSAEERMAAEPPPEDLPATHAFIVTASCGPGDGRVEAGEARVRVVVHRDEPSDHSTGFERWRVVRHEVVSPLGRPVQ
jgi:hypothetical protein